MKKVNKFLSQEDKVKIEMILRGRERQHRDLAKEIINKFIDSVNELIPAAAESQISIQGGKLSVIIAKK